MEKLRGLRRAILSLDDQIREAGHQESAPNNPQAAETGEYRGRLEKERSALTREYLEEEGKVAGNLELPVTHTVKYVVNGHVPRLEVLYSFHAGTQVRLTCDLSRFVSETEVEFELDDFPSSPFFQYEVVSFGTGW